MLSDLFDEQAQREQYDIAVRKESKEEGRAEGRAEGKEEGRAEGKAEGREEGRAEGIKDVIYRMLSFGKMSVEEIAAATGFKPDQINEIAAQM